MTKYSGIVETRKIDRLSTDDELDPKKQHALLQFRQDLDAVILSANQQILKRKLPNFDQDTMIRLAVRVAELRGEYLAKAISIADAEGPPSIAAIDELRLCRFAFDEMREAFDAIERVLERGYATVAGT